MRYLYGLIIFLSVPVVALASESEHAGAHMTWRVIDFIIFAALIVYFVRKPIVNFFKNRKKQIIDEIENAKKAKDQAQKLLSEVGEKLSRLSSEVENIVQIYKQMGDKEKEEYQKAAQALEEIFKKRLKLEKTMILNKTYKEYITQIISKAVQKSKERFSNFSTEQHRMLNKRYVKSLEVLYDK